MWVCAQIGAREHYAIARALAARNVLQRLITDAWVSPGSLIERMVRGQRSEDRGRRTDNGNQKSEIGNWKSLVAGRFHQELRQACVTAFTASLVQFELLAHLRGLRGWIRTIARNEWFQRKAVAALTSGRRSPTSDLRPTLFAYSYAALELFRYAKQRGWRTVLGQIDPGPIEEQIVAEEVNHEPEMGASWEPAPRAYWDQWREECALVDRIVVNSHWSRECLSKAGVGSDKLHVIPLVFETSGRSTSAREFPTSFSAARPLRVLFLGQINLRKGVARLIKAIRLLQDEPMEFHFVGPIQISIPDDLKNNPKIRWFGTMPRSEVDAFYKNADLLIFPTLSDGFGLTQLEAQAWSLPIIASKFCGDVVRDGVNGIVLQEVSPNAIAAALCSCLQEPARLRTFAANARIENFNLQTLADSLLALFDEHTEL